MFSLQDLSRKPLLRFDQVHVYQLKAIHHQCSTPYSVLWLDVGLGKTVITLTSIAHLIKTQFIKAVIVFAPIRVCNLVWRQEAAKWHHTKHLKFALVTGNKNRRIAMLNQKADVYLCNYENMEWLVEALVTYYVQAGKPLPFDGVVFDELSKCKNSSTKRVKAFMSMRLDMKWVTGLTATPASNGYKDLHGQYLVIDGGQRLGGSKTEFMSTYYSGGAYNKKEKENTRDIVKSLISDITIEMSAEDYNPLPKLIVNDIWVELPPDARAKYDQMEEEFFTQLDSGKSIEVFNTAALYNKCLQFANGAVYPVVGLDLYEVIHEQKLEALDDLIEEMSGAPLLCAYSYRSDADRIMTRFKGLNPINLTECKSERSLVNALNRWKNGNCRLMIGHPLSMGHGIDGLQDSCDATGWFGVNWSHDLYEQFNGRVRRQGQPKPVTCHRILCKDTLDIVQVDALAQKEETQEALRRSVKEYRAMKGL